MNLMRIQAPCIAVIGILFGLALPTAQATISGIVFQDYNSNGMRDAGSVSSATDRGVGGVTVTAYSDAAGACGVPATSSSASGTLGQFTLSTAGCPSGLLRIEFTGLPTGYAPGWQSLPSRGATLASGSAASTVQFLNDGATNVEVAINVPAQYCQNNPQYAVPTQAFGNPTASGVTNLSVLGRLPYSARGNNANPDGNPIAVTPFNLARSVQTGTLYGIAYDRVRDRLFASAYYKRHAGFGPAGTGAIYMIDNASTGSPSAPTLYADLNLLFGGITGADTARGDYEGGAGGDPSWDQIGKISFGDLEINEEGNFLYVVNLANRRMYRLPTTGIVDGLTITNYPIPNPCTVGTDARPFGLAIRGNTVYVGGVCSAQSSGSAANLSAWVYSFDQTTTTYSASPVLQFPLNYPRANANGGGPSDVTGNAMWNAWTTSQGSPHDGEQYPEPMLSDLAFDRNDLLLGFRDRHGDQSGTGNAGTIRGITGGELLRACANGAGGWDLEQNGACGGITGVAGATAAAPAGNQARGPGTAPAGGEYYPLDNYSNSDPEIDFAPRYDGLHDENAQGALLQVPGFDSVATTTMDPFRQDSGGMRWYSNSQPTSAALASGLQLYESSVPGAASFSKANGLGDLEALCNPAPIEVGNYVWFDADGDGLMDPGENPIANVALDVYDTSGTRLGSTITNSQGEYYFRFSRGTDSNANDNDIAQPASPFSGAYSIVVANSNFASGGPLANRAITVPMVAGSTALRDSNGVIGTVTGLGSVTHAALTLSGAGANDHSVDFGFGTAADYGDLPDLGMGTGAADYSTLQTDNGATHTILDGIRLGAAIDAESDGQPNAGANGDDMSGSPDDEDGVTSSLTFVGGSAAIVTLNATNTVGGSALLCGFIDFNGDGDFSDANETASTNVANGTSGGTATLNFGIPPLGVTNTYARFRINTNTGAGCSAVGAAANGEVEDYSVDVSSAPLTTDYGDLPDTGPGTGAGNYNTVLIDNGPRHTITTDLRIGANIDGESDGQEFGTAANGDDTNGTPDDEDGIAGSLSFSTGSSAVVSVNVTNTIGSAATLCGFIDFNNDGDFGDTNETTFTAVANGTSGGTAILNFGTTPGGAVPSTYARFRLSTTAGCSANGSAPNGEVEDYPVTVSSAPALDYGDLPDTGSGTSTGNYNTAQSDSGASHTIVANLHLGANIDSESNGQPGAGANGDDTTGGVDDEDGVTSGLSFTAGSAASVSLNVTNLVNPATLCGFIDFNGDGDFGDTNETASAPVSLGATGATISLNFGTTPIGSATNTYARFRISTAVGCAPTGAAPDGEVEDYAATTIAAAIPPQGVPAIGQLGLLLMGLLIGLSALFVRRV